MSRGYGQTDTHIVLLEVLIWAIFLRKVSKALKDFMFFGFIFKIWEVYSKILIISWSTNAI